MLKTTIKEYLMELYISLRSWKILLLVIVTVLVCFMDYDKRTGSSNYILMFWIMRLVNIIPRESDESKLIYLLPADTHWRALRMLYRAISSAFFIVIWRIGIYGIGISIGGISIEQAMLQFFIMDLLFAMIVTTPGELMTSSKVKWQKVKKTHRIFAYIYATFCGLSLLVYVACERLHWWNILLTVLAYLGIFIIWYYEFKNYRSWDMSYENAMKKTVK